MKMPGWDQILVRSWRINSGWDWPSRYMKIPSNDSHPDDCGCPVTEMWIQVDENTVVLLAWIVNCEGT